MGERNFVATVKEYGDGRPWVLVEMHEDIGLGDALVSLQFEPGTSYDQAQEVARLLNDRVAAVRLHK